MRIKEELERLIGKIKDEEPVLVSDQWSEKFLRESPFMPFGSICNIIAQAYQGRGINRETLRELCELAFELASTFTLKAFSRVNRRSEIEPDLK